MSVVPFQGPVPGARPPSVSTEMAHEVTTPRFAQAADTLAGKAGMAQSAAEAKDFAQAALFLVQAITTLDPNRLTGGDTPEARKASIPTPPAVNDHDRDGKIGE